MVDRKVQMVRAVMKGRRFQKPAHARSGKATKTPRKRRIIPPIR